jgi:PAS domain S-box-containing protein
MSLKNQVNHFLNNIINNVPHYIFWKDAKSLFLGCNKAFAELAKINSPEEVIGKTDFEMPWGNKYALKYIEDDKSVLKTGQSLLDYEESHIQKNGVEITVLVNKIPIFNDFNETIGLLGIFTDITNRKIIEKELYLAKEKAEASSRVKMEFIQNMSHDIRTPLTGIIGAALLLEKNAYTDEQRNLAHMVFISGHRLLDLLNDVLSMIAVEDSIDVDKCLETFDLTGCVLALRDLMLPIIQAKKIQLILNIHADIPVIMSDRIKIERILLNLISNAIKFTEKGQITLTISIIAQDDKNIDLKFTITDTGIGIPPEKIHQIFNRFFRGDSSAQGIYQGYGVGLYLVKKYLNLLKSDIYVSSQEKIGTSFYFSLMVKKGIAQEAKSISDDWDISLAATRLAEMKVPRIIVKKEKANSVKNSLNILYVEDDVIVANVTSNIIRGIKCVVDTAEDAETAFQLLKSQKYDLVITDVGLPGMSGAELTAVLRFWEKANKLEPIPVIALTGHATVEIEQECLLAGINKVIVKPLTENMAYGLINGLHKQLAGEKQSQSLMIEKMPAQVAFSEAELFQLEKYLLFDVNEAISLVGNKEFLKEALTLLLQQLNVGDEVAHLEKAYTDKNRKKISSISHKLKGAASYLGTTRMYYA